MVKESLNFTLTPIPSHPMVLFFNYLSANAVPSPPRLYTPFNLSHSHSFRPSSRFPSHLFRARIRIPSSVFGSQSSRTFAIPARDRVIDFGKYKGRMLGTLPSTYLRWISKNLRARDFEEWSNLADEVLDDPVYRDRIEWEFAEDVLNGNSTAASSPSSGGSAVSQLSEISERFGWDNEDKLGWSRVDFQLLGTSKGARIPRISPGRSRSRGVGDGEPSAKSRNSSRVVLEAEASERRRRERRERLRLKNKDCDEAEEDKDEKLKLQRNENGEEQKKEEARLRTRMENVNVYNPFPGREGLLRKVRNLKGNGKRSFSD